MRDRLDALIADVTFALRQLRRSPVLASAAILCFALGIGVNSAIFSIVNGVLLRPLPYRDADRIVVIQEGLPKMGPGMGRISTAEFLDYRELEGRVFQATAIYEARSFTVRSPDGSLERVPAAVVTGNFLRVLGREPMLGHIPETWLQSAANPNASLATAGVIVSHAFWRTRLGGDSSIIGKTMPLGNATATVAGVLPLRSGRTFSTSDVARGEPVAIIGEALARQRYGGLSAVGRRLKWGSLEAPSPWRTIVGVVADVKQAGLAEEEPGASIYMPVAQFDSGPVASMGRGQSYVVRTAGDPRATVSAVRRAVKEFDGLMPITGLSPMDELLSSTIADRRFNMFLLSAFAVVALSLAAIGIYGLIAYSVAQRTRELGIRIALGALPRDVLLLVIRQGARLALAGIVIGSLGAIAATRWMGSMLFRVDPLDPLTFAVVGVALAAVAIGATWAPALRAARVSPVTAMRTD